MSPWIKGCCTWITFEDSVTRFKKMSPLVMVIPCLKLPLTPPQHSQEIFLAVEVEISRNLFLFEILPGMSPREIAWKDFMKCAPRPAMATQTHGKWPLEAGGTAGRHVFEMLLYHQQNDPCSHGQINTSELRTALWPLGLPWIWSLLIQRLHYLNCWDKCPGQRARYKCDCSACYQNRSAACSVWQQTRFSPKGG